MKYLFKIKSNTFTSEDWLTNSVSFIYKMLDFLCLHSLWMTLPDIDSYFPLSKNSLSFSIMFTDVNLLIDSFRLLPFYFYWLSSFSFNFGIWFVLKIDSRFFFIDNLPLLLSILFLLNFYFSIIYFFSSF